MIEILALHYLGLEEKTPATWKTLNKNVLVVKLPRTEAEYQDIEHKFKSSAGGNFTVQSVSLFRM